MARARVSLWAICVLRVALATVYFQEEFLDGGESDGCDGRRSCPPAVLLMESICRLILLSPHRALEEPLGAVHQ